jgi:hypothetical protein
MNSSLLGSLFLIQNMKPKSSTGPCHFNAKETLYQVMSCCKHQLLDAHSTFNHQQATMSSDEESVGSNASEEEVTDLSNR